jgi:hypothetical protein
VKLIPVKHMNTKKLVQKKVERKSSREKPLPKSEKKSPKKSKSPKSMHPEKDISINVKVVPKEAITDREKLEKKAQSPPKSILRRSSS